MLTGDSRGAAQAVARDLGIGHVVAEVLPGDKADAAMHTAGVILMRGDPVLVAAAIDVSRRTDAKIKQGLFWAFIYNLVGIPLAALGYLNPVLAGGAMALSSVSVVVNALTLRGWKPGGR